MTLPCVRLSHDESEQLLAASNVECDPYDHMSWVISAYFHPEVDDADSISFDHAILTDGRIILMSVLNCESAHFIETFACFICSTTAAALETAREMVAEARDWFQNNPNHFDVEDNTNEWIVQVQRDLAPE